MMLKMLIVALASIALAIMITEISGHGHHHGHNHTGHHHHHHHGHNHTGHNHTSGHHHHHHHGHNHTGHNHTSGHHHHHHHGHKHVKCKQSTGLMTPNNYTDIEGCDYCSILKINASLQYQICGKSLDNGTGNMTTAIQSASHIEHVTPAQQVMLIQNMMFYICKAVCVHQDKCAGHYKHANSTVEIGCCNLGDRCAYNLRHHLDSQKHNQNEKPKNVKCEQSKSYEKPYEYETETGCKYCAYQFVHNKTWSFCAKPNSPNGSYDAALKEVQQMALTHNPKLKSAYQNLFYYGCQRICHLNRAHCDEHLGDENNGYGCCSGNDQCHFHTDEQIHYHGKRALDRLNDAASYRRGGISQQKSSSSLEEEERNDEEQAYLNSLDED